MAPVLAMLRTTFFATVIAMAFTSLGIGCGLIPGLSTSTGSGGSTAAASTGSATAVGGTECGTDPNTGAVLCIGNSVCPGVTVNQSTFPGCGFRVSGDTIDVECSCSGYLCPLGATTCADVTSMMSSSYLAMVCEELSSGGCVQGTAVATTTSSSSGSSSTCDTTCRDECGGEPTCLLECGC